MAKVTLAATDRLVSDLTVGDLREMIAETVREVVRKELGQDYYINEEGLSPVRGGGYRP